MSAAPVAGGGQDFTYAKPEARIESGDLPIVSGPTGLVEVFAALT